MGRADAAGGRDRGGDGIPALRAARVRVATALASLALLSGAAAYGVLVAPQELQPLVSFPAAAAVLLVGVALLLRSPALVPWGLATCLAAYAAGLVAGSGGLDPLAAVFAAALLLSAELAYWSLEERSGRETREVLLRRLAFAGVLAVATVGLGTLLLAAALIRPPGGPAVLALGVAGAVGAAALLARLAHGAGR